MIEWKSDDNTPKQKVKLVKANGRFGEIEISAADAESHRHLHLYGYDYVWTGNDPDGTPRYEQREKLVLAAGNDPNAG